MILRFFRSSDRRLTRRPASSTLLALILILALLAPGATATVTAQDNPPPLIPDLNQPQLTLQTPTLNLEAALETSDGRLRVIVELADPPVALYQGGRLGLAATSIAATGARKLNLASPASLNYTQHLERQQQAFHNQLSRLAPSASIDSQYQVAFNGVSITIAPQDLDRLQAIPGVQAVYPDRVHKTHMDASLGLTNAPAVWARLGGRASAGQGIFVAVIDTGIRPENPMFSGAGFSLPAGYPKGYCASQPNDPDFQCNNKLVGARFYNPPAELGVHSEEVLSPLDIDGHGSHTAGTAAGNPVMVSTDEIVPEETEISGVAPGAYLLVYKALFHTADGGGSATDSMLLGALNDALADGADVVNDSWGGDPGGSPATSPYQKAIRALVDSGVVVVFSAGNSGPDGNTISCPACVPDTLTVAASSTSRRFAKTLDVLGPGEVPAGLTGLEVAPGNGPRIRSNLSAPLRFAGAGNPAQATGCSAFPAGAFDNSIALIQRGVCSFAAKVDNAAAAGAVAAIIYNNAGEDMLSMAVENTTIPSYFTRQSQGEALRDWLVAHPGAPGRINYRPIRFNTTPDVLANFSSVGPNGDPDVLKPDITAPGVDILSAYSPTLSGLAYTQLSGTSMAAPHVAGAAALLKQLHPGWSPAQIKSALTSSAIRSVLQSDRVTPATPFHMGAGRLDLERASRVGVTFDRPSLARGACTVTCRWTLSIENVGTQTVTWNASVSSDNGLRITVAPANLELAAGAKAEFTVMADVSRLPPGEWHFGSVIWSAASGDYPEATLPLAVRGTTSTDESTLTKTASRTTVEPGGMISYTISLTNNFPAATEFTLSDPLPGNTNYVAGSATGGLQYNPDQDELTATLTLDAPRNLRLVEESSPYGYLPLVDYFSPIDCGGPCAEVILDITNADFHYNGQHYTELSIASNGFLIPGGSDSATPNNQELPDPDQPNNIIAPLWTDIDVENEGHGAWYAGRLTDTQTGDTFTIMEWENVRHAGETGSQLTFQVWIQDGTENIWFVYAEVNGNLEAATVGVEDDQGQEGQSYYYNGSGSRPQPGTDLKVAIDVATATFTFAVTVDPQAAQGEGILNVVEARREGSEEVITATASTTVGDLALYLPLVHR